jgi:hypothetical protein
MTERVHIENVVLGGGEAGKYIAWDLAQRPRRRRDRAGAGGRVVSEHRLSAEQERDPKCQGRLKGDYEVILKARDPHKEK